MAVEAVQRGLDQFAFHLVEIQARLDRCGALAVAAMVCAVIGACRGASINQSRSWSASIGRPRLSTLARVTMFSNSRTLPGQ